VVSFSGITVTSTVSDPHFFNHLGTLMPTRKKIAKTSKETEDTKQDTSPVDPPPVAASKNSGSRPWLWILALLILATAFLWVPRPPPKVSKAPSLCAPPEKYIHPTCRSTCTQKSLQSTRFPIDPSTVSNDISCHGCPGYQGPNTLFQSIQGYIHGRVLDSGTGTSSMSFLHHLQSNGNITSITGITASQSMYEKVQSLGTVIKGNWADEGLLQGQVFDTVLVDYLVGSMEAFAPYTQSKIFTRLGRHVDVGGAMLVLGWEPMPDSSSTKGEELLLEVIATQNACIHLGKGKTYREYPRHVIEEYLVSSGWNVVQRQSFPIVYGPRKLHRLLNSCDFYLERVQGRTASAVKNAMKQRVKELRLRIDSNQELSEGLCFGMDYAIVAKRE
jgi:hypothetical protein